MSGLGDVLGKILDPAGLLGGLLGGNKGGGDKGGGGKGLFGALIGLVSNFFLPGSGPVAAGVFGMLTATDSSSGVADSIGAGMSSLLG